MIKKLLFVLAFVLLPLSSWAQSSLPPCPTGGIKLSCYGKQSYPDGEYVGEFQNGVPNGKGRFEYGNGGKYVGFWKNAFPNGEGIQYSYDGKVAQSGYWVGGNLSESKDLDLESFPYSSARLILGSMRNPALSQNSLLPPCPESGLKQNCFGTSTFASGAKYAGEFKDGKPNGQGTATFASGEKYVGEFKDGTPHGQGIEYYADGSVKQSGRWENNHFRQSYALDTSRFPFDPTQVTVTPPVDPGKSERDRLVSEVEAERKKRQELETQLAEAREREKQVAEAKERERQQAPQPQRPQVALRNELRLALVIGNSSYKVSPLDNPANDANDVAESLKKFGFQTTLVRNATLGQMREATRKFADQLPSADVALIYFAGHGIVSSNKNYMIPINADLSNH
jgi:hypothetical protein